MLKLRCSSLPIVAQCAAAAVPPKLHIDNSGPEALLGTAVHAWILDGIAGKRAPDETPEDYASLFKIANVEEFALLCWLGWNAWQEIEGYFDQPAVETALEFADRGVMLTGHLDVYTLSPSKNEARIADFKSGWADSDHTEQLKGYAFLLTRGDWQIKTVRTAVVRIRDGEADWETYTRQQLLTWWLDLVKRLRDRDTYRPGAYCAYCPRALECEAKTNYVVRSIREMLGELLGDGTADIAETARLTYDRVRLVEGACQRAREVLQLIVGAAGGALDFGDGRGLVTECQQRKEINAFLGLSVLITSLPGGLDQLLDLVDVRKKDLDKAVRDSVPRGQKKRAVDRLYEALDQAGAISVKTTTRLECRRKGLPLIQHEKETSDANDNAEATRGANAGPSENPA